MGKKGDSGSNSQPIAPTHNSAERQAFADYASEALSTDKDPIPSSPPDWAKDIPSPSGGNSGSGSSSSSTK